MHLGKNRKLGKNGNQIYSISQKLNAIFNATLLQARRPAGIEIAALVRPPDPDAGESESLWAARARISAARGPFGLHTHWGGATQARPLDGDPAALVRTQLDWLDERGFQPRLFLMQQQYRESL